MSNKDKFYTLIILLFLLISCNKKERRIILQSDVYMEISKESISEGKYREVYKLMNDSVKVWVENKLYSYKIATEPYQIDSLLCFNRNGDKVISAFKYQYTSEPTNHDGIIFFYGVKIQEKWYFFTGASIHLPREFYQKDIHTPLSFEKLHEIAMREVYSGYLIKHKKDAGFWNNTFAPQYEYEVNDAWFDRHFKNKGVCSYCETEEDFEEVWKYNALYIWKQ